jgi:hypothetical protein
MADAGASNAAGLAPAGTGEMDILYWQAGARDDAAVARAVWARQDLHAVWALDQTALLDDYYYYLKKAGVWEMVGRLTPEEGERFMVPFWQLVMLYLTKQACGIRAMNALPELLFSNEGAMRLLGFNAHQLHEGVCRRGQWRRKEPEKYGPVCPEMLAENIAKMGAATVENLFNGAIRKLARQGVYPEHITGCLDATDLVTTEHYKGCGSVTRKKHVRDHKAPDGWREIEVTVHGWKLWGMMDSVTCSPLSALIAPINTDDRIMTRRSFLQAKENLSRHATIDAAAIDRGFLDGEDLWWLKEQKIHFVMPAKTDMVAYDEARKLAAAGKAGEVFPARRLETVTHGQGRKARTEEVATALVGVPGLACYDAYGPPGHGEKANRKDFAPNPLNSVVVGLFKNRPPRAGAPGVLLTDLPVDDPFVAFDLYDQRSRIENGLWRNGKQYWHLSHPPQRTGDAMTSHVYLTLMTMAATTAFRAWAEKQQAAHQSGQRIGIQRYWRKLEAQNAGKVIVFSEDRYGIFYLSELLALAGLHVTEPLPGARSLEQLRAAYHLM